MYKLPIEALKLFKEFDPGKPETAEIIYARIASMQKRYTGQTPYRILEGDRIGVPCMATNFVYYPQVRRLFGPGKFFLDAGCGLGSDVRKAIRDGIDPDKAVGLTIKPEEIEWGYELFGDGDDPKHSGRYIVWDVRNIEMEKGSVDFLNNISLIHTLGKKEIALDFLSEARRVLRPGGVFFGTTNGDNKEVIGPHYRISKDSLENYLAELGFRDIAITQRLITRPVSFEHASTRMRSKNKRMPSEPVKLHFLARK